MDRFEVFFTASAEHDLLRIAEYICGHHSAHRASAVVQEIKKACTALSRFPHRGVVIEEYQHESYFTLRQLLCGVYRLIYEIDQLNVTIIAIVDSRRDLQQFLSERRLQRPR